MALTRETIIANQSLAALTQDQLDALVTLSKNDEDATIGKRLSEVYQSFDEKVKTFGGIERKGDEKTYDYVQRALTELKESSKGSEELNKQIQTLTAEKTRLEKAVAEGADAETKKLLQQTQADLENVKTEYTKLETSHKEAVSKHTSELFGLQVGTDITNQIAKAGIKLKAELPEQMQAFALSQAIEFVKGSNPQYIDSGKNDGTKVLAFHGSDNAVLRNNENGLNPYTAADLVKSKLKELGALDEGRQQSGAGTGGNQGGSNAGATVDISGAKTKVEATKMIETGLAAQGLVKGSSEHQAALDKAWADNKVADLPTT